MVRGAPRLLPITLPYVTPEQLLAMCATRWPPACLQLQHYIKQHKKEARFVFLEILLFLSALTNTCHECGNARKSPIINVLL